MTIEERIKTHLSEARNLDTDNRLEMAHWQATHDVLSKLQQIKEDSAWLAHTLQDLVEQKGSTLLRGRALEGQELSALFRVCVEDPSPAGRRDAAMLAVLYGAGIRRAELAGLDLNDFTHDACSLRVRNGKRQKQRTVYLAKQGCALVKGWIRERGDEPGPLFCPVN